MRPHARRAPGEGAQIAGIGHSLGEHDAQGPSSQQADGPRGEVTRIRRRLHQSQHPLWRTGIRELLQHALPDPVGFDAELPDHRTEPQLEPALGVVVGDQSARNR